MDDSFEASTSPIVEAMRDASRELGLTVYLVGGFVRDRLRGAKTKDIDCVILEEEPERYLSSVASRLSWSGPVLFETYGTAQIHGDGHIVEAVRARAESYDRHSRKPRVAAGSIEEDVWRRDFTVNALLETFDGEILDLTGRGLEDLGRRILRTPKDPVTTFSDDPLRIIRAARFSAQLGFDFADGLVEAMRTTAHRIPESVSIERVTAELQLLLMTATPSRGIRALLDAGALDLILPELPPMVGVEQGGYHPDDVFDHSMMALDEAPMDEVTRLAALLHDVGKPSTHELDPTGKHTFYGHPQAGAKLAKEALTRLRFSHETVSKVSTLVRLHMRPIQYTEDDFSDSAVRRLIRDSGDLREQLVDLAIADTRASTYPGIDELEHLRERMEALEKAGKFSRLHTALDGNELMQMTGWEPGPRIKALKTLIEEAILEGEIPPDSKEEERDWLSKNRARWESL